MITKMSYMYRDAGNSKFAESEGDFVEFTGDADPQVSKEDLIAAFKKASEDGWPGQYTFEGW